MVVVEQIMPCVDFFFFLSRLQSKIASAILNFMVALLIIDISTSVLILLIFFS
jgi:hypothetical protein